MEKAGKAMFSRFCVIMAHRGRYHRAGQDYPVDEQARIFEEGGSMPRKSMD
jgi:hypothetical protein